MLNNGYSLIAQFAGSPDDGRKRKEMLRLACELSEQPSKCAALLWLYDRDYGRLQLDYYEPLDEPHQELRRLFIPYMNEQLDKHNLHSQRTNANSKNNESTEISISLANEVGKLTSNEAKIKAWIKKTVPDAFQNLFPFRTRTSIGFLEILSAQELDEDTKRLYRSYAEVIAGRITRHRDHRKLQVYAHLTTLRTDQIDVPDQGTQRWLEVAAQVAQEATSAEIAVVFSESPDLNLKAMACHLGAELPNNSSQFPIASASSLVQIAYSRKKAFRVLDHQDTAEREKLFNQVLFDQSLTEAIENRIGKPLRSWIAAPVICDGEPLAVVLVANKQPADYFPEVFSGTDFELVKNICDVVSRGLAQSRTNQAIRAISNFTFKHDIRFDQLTYPNDPKHNSNQDKTTLIRLVREHVPGVVAGVVSIRFRIDENPGEVWPLGELEPQLLHLLTQNIQRPVKHGTTFMPIQPVTLGGQQYYLYEESLQTSGQDRFSAVHLLTRRDRLAKHHIDVLKYLNADIGQLVRSTLMVRHHVDEWTQLRHAIRSGLQGVRHVETAYAVYEQIAKKGMTPSDFRVSMLRKSLELTRLFADRCSILLEESRFLLGRLKPEELRHGGTSIVRLVAEVIACLKPYADERDIVVVFQNSLPRDRTVTLDHELMRIAIFNILDNAIKYSHRKKDVIVRLGITGKNWKLMIIDRGVYIHPQEYEAIFRPFVRRPTGHAQNTRPGTGLGLAVVKQIVDAHNGEVRVISRELNNDRPEDGADTTFTIIVPS